MSHTEKPRGFSWLTPSITVADIEASINFYDTAFGFEKGEILNDDLGIPSYADMRYQDETLIMIMSEGAFGGRAITPNNSNTHSPVGLYVYCENIDELFKRATGAGAAMTSPPEDMFWGDRVARLVDLDGHSWSFASRIS